MINAYGFAMMEELTVDEGGRVTNPSFADFKMPTEPDIPELRIGLVETSEGRGALPRQGRRRALQPHDPAGHRQRHR